MTKSKHNNLDQMIQEQLKSMKNEKTPVKAEKNHRFIKIFGGLILAVVILNLLLNML